MKFDIQRNVRPTTAVYDKPEIAARINWPWRDMAPGDEVLITDDAIARKAQVSAHVYARQKGWAFKTTTTDQGLVVWRQS